MIFLHFTIRRTKGEFYIKNGYSNICASHVHNGLHGNGPN